jgi:UDP-N-acetylmuramoylalanine--D-glutamate ligase
MTPFEKFKKAYQGKKVLVMGLGLLGGGVGVARIFAEIGAKVTVTDLKNEKGLAPSLKKLQGLEIRFVLGKHDEKDFKTHDLIIRNPAVPKNSPFLQIARKNKISITMDTSLFTKFCARPLIGVTGTRGKTTTATLIYELLKGAGKNVFLGGNIKGVATLPLLKKIRDGSIIVLELSSWELQGFDWEKISPHIAVITNIYQDHLSRYQNMEEYVNDKKVIFKYQKSSDFLVLNQKNAYTRKIAKNAKSKTVWFSAKDFPAGWKLRLIGKHNKENAAAALKVGEIMKLEPLWMKPVLETFRGVEYRLEEIREIDGVKYINDTTSTTPAASLAAIKSFKNPIILLAGGASKNLDLSELAFVISKKVKKLVLLEGTATDELASLINQTGGGRKVLGRFNNFKKAIMAARQTAAPGNVILLSPGCASFGMFQNEYDRGNQFNKIVRSL